MLNKFKGLRSSALKRTLKPKPKPKWIAAHSKQASRAEHARNTKTAKTTTAHDRFNNKLAAQDWDNFNGTDLVYYFIHTANDAGFKYSTANLSRDVDCMNSLLDAYGAPAVVGMIDFVYRSGQRYLDCKRLSPNFLASNWRNTVYPDSIDWLGGNYNATGATNTKRQTNLHRREWGAKQERCAKIGGWEDD